MLSQVESSLLNNRMEHIVALDQVSTCYEEEEKVLRVIDCGVGLCLMWAHLKRGIVVLVEVRLAWLHPVLHAAEGGLNQGRVIVE